MESVKPTITVEVVVKSSIDKVWDAWNNPEAITKWNFASDDWHCPSAGNDLKPGGTFSYRMEAKDGSFGFDFGGTYTRVEAPNLLEYQLGDHRKVVITFKQNGSETLVSESFVPEDQNSGELQRQGWQAILENFRKYCEK